MARSIAPSLVLGLPVLALRVGVGDDARPGLDVGPAAAHQDRPDVDAGIEISGVAEITDGTGVRPSAQRLELIDDLHSPHFGRARDRPCREDGAQGVHRPHPGLQLARHRRDHMHHVAVSLHVHEAFHPDRARPADPAEVVAAEVDQHQVLGPFLLVLQHLFSQTRVLGRRGSPRSGPGDRSGLRETTGHRHQRLGAGPDDLEIAERDVVHVGARVHRSQSAVDRERAHRDRRSKRCDSTTWNASPARMYSRIRSTASRKRSPLEGRPHLGGCRRPVGLARVRGFSLGRRGPQTGLHLDQPRRRPPRSRRPGRALRRRRCW